MWPPQDRINYAEMRVQKIQIPIQVPVLKPIYVDYPYPNYKFVEGESKVTQLQRKYFGGDIKNILSHTGASKKLEKVLYDDTSSESEPESGEEIKVIKETRNSKQLNAKTETKTAQVTTQNEQGQYQVNFQNQQQNQVQQQSYGVEQQQQYIQPPIQLDYPTANQYKPPSANQSFIGNQQYQQQQQQLQRQQSQLQQTNQFQNTNIFGKDSNVSQNVSKGRDLINQMKNQSRNGGEFGQTSQFRI